MGESHDTSDLICFAVMPPAHLTTPLPTLLVTGGAGFVGSNFVLSAVQRRLGRVITLDKLTYAGNRANLAPLAEDATHEFLEGDIADRPFVTKVLAEHRPRFIVNFAAESHVDRSIDGPADFVRTNLVGTFELLEACRAHVAALPAPEARSFRFLHVSTDEVYGSLSGDGAFTEQTRFAPNSPYAATKAGADHLVRSYFKTYGLPAITTHCSNNYGPLQFPEKLIPLVTLNALEGRPLPVYGDGKNVRDWVHVEDHCAAIRAALEGGTPGDTYNIGGGSERSNLEVVEAICALLEELAPRTDQAQSYRALIEHVADRPGHDRRYAVDTSKITRELGWTPKHTFGSGLRHTVRWYLDNRAWCDGLLRGRYRRERLGLSSLTRP